ncbi:MAG: hypothetical protein K1X89_08525 [Myxococcaceae bacterium]|nr:hypothetical protein [Myxococcaceae bacterium]
MPASPQELETIARDLKAQGWNSSVVARKMIELHGMDEPRALELVGGLYGKRVSARTGDTTSALLTAGLLVAAGVGVALVTWQLDDDGELGDLLWGGLVLVGAGLSRGIIALVNAGAKDDLRTRRD